MQLIDDWKWVALRSHSERANLLGILILIFPEAWYLFMEYDLASPRLWWFLGIGLLIYGYVFRLVKQRRKAK